jgi:hypothetical protein
MLITIIHAVISPILRMFPRLSKRPLLLMEHPCLLRGPNSLKEGSWTSQEATRCMGKDATESRYLAYIGVGGILFRTTEGAICILAHRTSEVYFVFKK